MGSHVFVGGGNQLHENDGSLLQGPKRDSVGAPMFEMQFSCVAAEMAEPSAERW